MFEWAFFVLYMCSLIVHVFFVPAWLTQILKASVRTVCSDCVHKIKNQGSIPFWSLGQAHHIELRSQSFDCSEQSQNHTLKALQDCCLTHPIHVCICDRSGNRTPLKTKLNLTWKPASAGATVSKRTRDKGDTSFTAYDVRCTAKPDQNAKIRVTSAEHRTLQVDGFPVVIILRLHSFFMEYILLRWGLLDLCCLLFFRRQKSV